MSAQSPGEWRGELDSPPGDELADSRAARTLLGSLLRPYRMALALLGIVVIAENAARLSVPLLVQRGIDHAIPPLLAGGSATELLAVVGALCAVAVVQAVSRMVFLAASGRMGQRVLLELRRRLFRHFCRLDVAFHDRYTSGRVVSRSTNDIEAIQEMLETGFDSLVTAVLTLFGTAVLLVVLDVRLGLMCLVAVPVLLALLRWFSVESTRTYRTVRESAALVIVEQNLPLVCGIAHKVYAMRDGRIVAELPGGAALIPAACEPYL